ncbi:MAG: p-aminobenzoyl-glutamate hydrolase subunit, partial [Bacteroidota bacterium]
MKKYLLLFFSFCSTIVFAQTIPANKQAVLSSVAKHEKELIGLSDEVWAHAEIAMKEHQSAKA